MLYFKYALITCDISLRSSDTKQWHIHGGSWNHVSRVSLSGSINCTYQSGKRDGSAMPKHDDVNKWKYFPRYWPFVRGIHRSLVKSPHKGQWHGALKFALICTWINGWVINREADDLRRHRAHFDVFVMITRSSIWNNLINLVIHVRITNTCKNILNLLFDSHNHVR